jgi:glycosyltransferase involved in cell wall biosynthesis
MIEDGVSGLLIPAADPIVFSERLELLLRDAALRERLGQAARRRVAGLFSAATFDQAVRGLVQRWLMGTGPTVGPRPNPT